MPDVTDLTEKFETGGTSARQEKLLDNVNQYLSIRKNDPHAKRIKALIKQHGKDETALRNALISYLNNYTNTPEMGNAFDAVEIITQDPIYKNYRYTQRKAAGKEQGYKPTGILDKILDLFKTDSSLKGEASRVYGELHNEEEKEEKED